MATEFGVGDRVRYEKTEHWDGHPYIWGTVLCKHDGWVWLDYDDRTPGTVPMFVLAERCVVLTDTVVVEIQRSDAETLASIAPLSDNAKVRLANAVFQALEADRD